MSCFEDRILIKKIVKCNFLPEDRQRNYVTKLEQRQTLDDFLRRLCATQLVWWGLLLLKTQLRPTCKFG